MSGKMRSSVVLGVAMIAPCLAWQQGLSVAEGVYFAIPLLALAWHLTNTEEQEASIRPRIRKIGGIASALIVLGVALAGAVFGPPAILSWRFWIEVSTALYFLASFFLLMMMVRRLMKAAAEWLCDRWSVTRARVLWCEMVPLTLFILLAVPFGMAFSHVHRFKLPNLNDPLGAFGRHYVDVEFRSGDGTRLSAWWIPARQPSTRTLVFCHGIGSNRSTFLPFIEVADWLDANMLMLDLRGHGESAGRTVTNGYFEQQDARAAIAFLRQEKAQHARQIVGMGVSLGAATMALAAAEVQPPLDAVILDSSFTSTRAMTAQVLDGFPAFTHGWLTTLGLPLADWHAGCAMTAVAPEQTIHQLRAPVLFLHSRGDPVIPSEHSQRLHRRASGPKHLHVFELPGHCDGFFQERDAYRHALSPIIEALDQGKIKR